MDGIAQTRTLAGVVISAASSAGSAIYKVFFKKVFGEVTFCQVAIFFSMIGLCSLVLLWPIFLALYFSGAGKKTAKKYLDTIIMIWYLILLETIPWSTLPWPTLIAALFLSLGMCLQIPLGDSPKNPFVQYRVSQQVLKRKLLVKISNFVIFGFLSSNIRVNFEIFDKNIRQIERRSALYDKNVHDFFGIFNLVLLRHHV